MADGYCETDDVKNALQKPELKGNVDTAEVKPAIKAVSDWLRRQAGGHWYDSGGSASDLVATSARTASNVVLDVPSSPHAHDRQLHFSERGMRYPVTTAGPYAKVRLPHRHVTTLSTLDVRDTAGEVTDWVSNSDFSSGTGNDYYLQNEGETEYGQSYLYVRAGSIGPRVDFENLLTLKYDYGLDAQTDEWQDVRRGVANLAAAQVVTDDDVLAQIPDNGQLINVETQRQAHVNDAITRAWSHLRPYLTTPVA